MPPFPAIQSLRAVDLVAERLRQRILRGTHEPGTALPAERTLAVELGISRPTLRAAVSRLESEGILEPRQGDAVRVLDWRRRGHLGLLEHLVGVDPRMLRSFLELRRAVAAEAVGLACERATATQRQQLAHLAAAQAAEQDKVAFAERDLAFVRLLLEAAHNEAMLLLFNSVESVYHAHPEIAEALLGELEEVRPSYAAVVALLEGGDPALARTAVRQVLEDNDARALRRYQRASRKRDA